MAGRHISQVLLHFCCYDCTFSVGIRKLMTEKELNSILIEKFIRPKLVIKIEREIYIILIN